MGYCLTHNQNYDERHGGFCYQCRDAANIKVVSTTSTNNARDEICPTCGGHGHVWSAFNEILYCRKCSGTGKLSPVA
jgi:DnaJ-class molecular chaperone